jgi:hypothetical protein
MASKQQMTQAKRAREQAVRERRARKQAKRELRRAARNGSVPEGVEGVEGVEVVADEAGSQEP